ncbi:MAG: hypothetical protein ABIP48_08425 [Planctomycetota bacterium]
MSCPTLLTPGRIAEALGVPLHRVQHILSTRSQICPSARAGTLRLFDKAAVAQIEHELNAIDARRGEKGEVNAK